jgi:hypothetical protein
VGAEGLAGTLSAGGARSPRGPADGAAALAPEERRWLHDKYERLAAQEAELAASRTSYYAAIGTVLITGLLIALADLMAERTILQIVVTFLAALGILISVVWAILLHRTNDAQNLWRDSARHLEEMCPPVETSLRAPVSLRSGLTLDLDLSRPYSAHAVRFSRDHRISWMDRINPSAMTEVLPLTFFAIWTAVLVASWTAFLWGR